MTAEFSKEFANLVEARQWLDMLINKYHVDPEGSFMEVFEWNLDRTPRGISVRRLSDLLSRLDKMGVPRAMIGRND